MTRIRHKSRCILNPILPCEWFFWSNVLQITNSFHCTTFVWKSKQNLFLSCTWYSISSFLFDFFYLWSIVDHLPDNEQWQSSSHFNSPPPPENSCLFNWYFVYATLQFMLRYIWTLKFLFCLNWFWCIAYCKILQ